MRRTKTLASLVAALVFALALGGYAYAHPLNVRGFESDLSQDGVINVCNPDDVRPRKVSTAIWEWNNVEGQEERPTLIEGPTSEGFCEVTVEEWSGGGGQPDFYARMVFGVHPDTLQISRRFAELPEGRRQGVITHEFGHVLGLDHPPATAELCEQSVMTTIVGCSQLGLERTRTPGSHDVADLDDYWVDTPIYPIQNKCWDNTDANGDRVCDRYGPPRPSTNSTLSPSSREGSGGGGGRNEGTSGPSSAVQVPVNVIKD